MCRFAGVIAWIVFLCIASACGERMTPIGGQWFIETLPKLPETGPEPRNLMRETGGKMVKVDEFIEAFHHYEPDCVVYQTARSSHQIFAVCDDRTPVRVATSIVSRWQFRPDGLHRAAEPQLVRGELVATTEFIPADDLRRAASQQPPFRTDWTSSPPASASIDPVRQQTPMSVDARGAEGQTPLIRAVASGRADLVDQLIAAGADVNARSDSGATALMIASGTGQTGIVERLLHAGANPNIQDAMGRTALMDAAGVGGTEIVRILIAAGADASLQDSEGRTARQQISSHSRNVELLQLLEQAERR